MDRLIDWISGLPKAVLILLVAVIMSLLGFAVYWFAFADRTAAAEEEAAGAVLLEVPGATIRDNDLSRVETYRREGARSAVSASEFWDQLEAGNGGLLIEEGDSGLAQAVAGHVEEELDPSIYSEMEIYYIRQGTKTKAQVDAEHAARAREAAAAAASAPQSARPADSDSAYFARMERAFEMAQKYSSTPSGSDSGVSGNDVSVGDSAARTIEIPEPSTLPQEVFSGDGVITSLEGQTAGTIYTDGNVQIRPTRATFLKTERVVDGQRVIMRLKEEMRLSNGTVIPENTHVSGICRVGTRLCIEINTVNYGDRIYRTDMDVYDNDGIEGIYCPVIEQNKGKKAAGKVAGQAMTGIASTAATLFTGNPIVGRVASNSIHELSRTTLSNGSVAIDIVAGYDFYIFENVGKN